MSYGKKRDPAEDEEASAETPLWEAQERLFAAGLKHFADFEKV
jgi:hypothetical protein